MYVKGFGLLVEAALKTRGFIRSSFIVSNLKTIMQLKILKEVSLIMDALDLNMFFSGGFAYDIILGKLTRSHEDIDITAKELDRETIIAAFKDNGFRIFNRQNGITLAIKKGVKVDTFYWHEIDENNMEIRVEHVIRLPKEFFAYDVLSFRNSEFRVSCVEFILCLGSMIKKESSKLLISKFKTTHPIICD